MLFDTSAALAFVDVDNPLHESVWAASSKTRRGLSGHAASEFLSVLTRLPLPKRLSGADARRLMKIEFPDSRYLPADVMDALLDEFASSGIGGGMVYDGLVGACARHHDMLLLSCGRRAEDVYRLLGVRYQLIVAEDGAHA